MKKLLVLIAVVICGWLVIQMLPETQPVLGRTSLNGAGSPNRLGQNLSRKGEANDQLELLAQQNEAFRWSLDIENKNISSLLYKPNTESDFRHRFELDSANQRKQSWSGEGGRWQYKEWVGGFYSGQGVMGSGWTASAKKILGENPPPETVRYVNVLGRLIAFEWSKSVRKLDNMDLLKWKSLQTVEKLPELAQAVCDCLSK